MSDPNRDEQAGPENEEGSENGRGQAAGDAAAALPAGRGASGAEPTEPARADAARIGAPAAAASGGTPDAGDADEAGDVEEMDEADADPTSLGPLAEAALQGLTPRQERAIMALLVEPSIAQAARSAGVGNRTLHKWLTRYNFMRAYRQMLRLSFSQSIGLCQKLASMAVGTLAKIMADPTAPATARVAAAATLLKFGRESLELDDLAERVEDLEETARKEAQRDEAA